MRRGTIIRSATKIPSGRFEVEEARRRARRREFRDCARLLVWGALWFGLFYGGMTLAAWKRAAAAAGDGPVRWERWDQRR